MLEMANTSTTGHVLSIVNWSFGDSQSNFLIGSLNLISFKPCTSMFATEWCSLTFQNKVMTGEKIIIGMDQWEKVKLIPNGVPQIQPTMAYFRVELCSVVSL